MISDAAEVLHQPVEFFKCRPATALNRFSYQPKLLYDGDGVVECLTR